MDPKKRKGGEEPSTNKNKHTKKNKDGEGSLNQEVPVVNLDLNDDDSCPFDVEPSAEFTKTTVFVTTLSPGSRPGSSKKNKRSFKKLSVGNSLNIPLNDDCTELVEDEKDDQLEKSSQKTAAQFDNEQELSIIKSMSVDEMQEHVKRCLELSSENKINSKNAFALKLIDCMTIISKNDDENNFAAMACQLDAGAKIYSHRVDAVHQQVMKLVETCMLAEVRNKKTRVENGEEGDSGEENGEPFDSKEKAKKKKKIILATSEQISRQPKETDPREKFVRLEALPGDILEKAKRDPTDLSLSLDKHTPFWMNYQDCPPTSASGFSEIPHIVIKNRRLGPVLEVDRKFDFSTIPKLDPNSFSCDDNNDYYEDPFLDNAEDEKEVSLKEDKESAVAESKSEVEMISLARSRMTVGGPNEISRLDVIKALFHRPGESDYHYLKMENSDYWSGPSYWKRPQGLKHLENKKKTVRKKREPQAIEYTEEAVNKSLKLPKGRGLSMKKNTTLARRTLAKWSKKKVTYPPDIHFRPQSFLMLYRADIMAQVIVKEQNQQDDGPQNDAEIPDGSDADMGDDLDESMENLELNVDPPDNASQGDANPESTGEGSQLDFDLPPMPSVSQMNVEHGDDSVAGPSGLGSAGTSAGTCDVYEGDNLVPMVKMVKVNPIKCVAKPSRIDMSHLKDVMLGIILQAIEDRENEMRNDGVSSPQGSVLLKDIYQALKHSDKLRNPTRDDVTFQMAFFCLLTLTNENGFSLVNNEEGDVVIRISSEQQSEFSLLQELMQVDESYGGRLSSSDDED